MSAAKASSDDIITESGLRVPILQPAAPYFLDRSIVAYGPSRTGKTVIIKGIMKILAPHIESILVVCPTESTNPSYAGFVDKPFIHARPYMADPKNPKKEDLKRGVARFLEMVWARQEMMAATYRRANDPKVLATLFARLPDADIAEGRRHIRTIRNSAEVQVARTRAQYRDDPGRSHEKVNELREKFRDMLVLIYKKYITPRYEELWEREDLTEAERNSLAHLTFNPRLLLIFDDCAASFKSLWKTEIIRQLFYQNRHAFITVIFSCQDDTDIDANLRKSSFVSFYTTPVVTDAFFSRAANQFPKDTIKTVRSVLHDVFGAENRKFAYIRDDPTRRNYYGVTFPYPTPFRFGSAAIHELCDRVQETGVAIDTENPFFNRFQFS